MTPRQFQRSSNYETYCDVRGFTGSSVELVSADLWVMGTEKVMKTEGKSWKLARWLLVAGVCLQIYFVQELVAAFAFFAIGFMAIAFVIVSLYMLAERLGKR